MAAISDWNWERQRIAQSDAPDVSRELLEGDLTPEQASKTFARVLDVIKPRQGPGQDQPVGATHDFTNRLSCFNHALVEPGPIVIAGTDPGGHNWLDAEGRDAVLRTIRWWGAPATPHVDARVVPLGELDLPVVDRQAQIERRSAHVAWRYRT